MTVSSGASVTSTTGAKSTVIPRSFIARPRLRAMAVHLVRRGSGGKCSRGRLRADDARQALYPAALFVDADRQGQRAGRRGDLAQGPVLQHRQVGPAADHDAADVLVGHDGAGVGGAGDADHQKLGELVAGGQGVDHGLHDGAVGGWRSWAAPRDSGRPRRTAVSTIRTAGASRPTPRWRRAAPPRAPRTPPASTGTPETVAWRRSETSRSPASTAWQRKLPGMEASCPRRHRRVRISAHELPGRPRGTDQATRAVGRRIRSGRTGRRAAAQR